jgi:hypothetical protein
MLRSSLVLFAALLAAGCQSQSESARMANSTPTGAELAAYAGAHQYPTTMPSSDHLRIAAVVNRTAGTIKIYNFDQKPIDNANVWINQAFVEHIHGIAPRSSVIIKMADLYNGLGQNFLSLDAPVSTVQVESGDRLLTAQGPVAE